MAKIEKYDPNIMLAVFEDFLENIPQSGYSNGECTDSYIAALISRLPSFHSYLVRWHFAVLIDEYVIPWRLLSRALGRTNVKEPTDHLNRSGQELYEKLKARHDQVEY